MLVVSSVIRSSGGQTRAKAKTATSLAGPANRGSRNLSQAVTWLAIRQFILGVLHRGGVAFRCPLGTTWRSRGILCRWISKDMDGPLQVWHYLALVFGLVGPYSYDLLGQAGMAMPQEELQDGVGTPSPVDVRHDWVEI